MPTVDRVSLRNLIDSARRLDELGVARVIANIAEVVHKRQKGGQPLGRITPDAIVVAADGEVTLEATEPRPAYTAPEQLRGETGDRRSDVFALGAVLWEALAHEQLFQGEIDNEVKAAVLEGEYRSASEANANVPAELDVICKKALARSPADRFPSCKVMAAELATVLDDAGYPEDNSAIAEHIATKYVPPEPRPAPVVTSRATPLPGSPIVETPLADRPATQTLQGVAPRKELDEALAKAQAQQAAGDTPRANTPSEAPIPLVPKAPVLPATAPDAARAKTPSSQPVGDTARAKTPSSQPVGDAARAKTPSSQPLAEAHTSTAQLGDALRAKTPSSQPVGDTSRAKTPSSQPVGDPARAKTPSSQPVGDAPRAKTPSSQPLAGAAHTSTAQLGDTARAMTPSSQPVGDAPRAKTPSSQPVGDAPRAKTPSSQPVGDAPRAKTPSSQPVGGLPAWATARPGSASQAPPVGDAKPADPGTTLPGMPTMLNTPPPASAEARVGTKTAILGSLSSADLVPPAEPSTASATGTTSPVTVGKKTEVHGSASLADRLAAINAAQVPGLPAVPPGADPASAIQTPPPGTLTIIPPPATAPAGTTPPATITTAETVPTPALATYAAAEAKAAAALDAVQQPPPGAPQVPAASVLPAAVETKTPPPSEAVAMPAAATGTAVSPADATAEAAPHPASVVALPRARSKSEAGAVRDPLAGWGWGTGPHEAIQTGDDDDDFYEAQRSNKKRLVIAIGAAAGAVLLVVVAAFAFGGKDEPKQQPDVAAKGTEPAVDWSQPTDPPPAPASDPAVDPAAGSASADPNAGSAVTAGSAADATGSAAPATAGSATDLAAGSATDLATGSGSATDLAAGSAAAAIATTGSAAAPTPAPTPPAPAPVAVTPPPPAPVAVTPTPPAPVAVTPPKPTPPKPAPVKVEPKKPEPKVAAKPEPKKPQPKSSWDPLKPTVKPVEARKRKDAPKPIDPYAEPPKKVDANAAYRTGIQQFARGDAAGALSTFKASLAAHPEFAPTWRGIGMVYEKLGKKSQAKTAFRRYLQLSPKAGDAAQIRQRMERL